MSDGTFVLLLLVICIFLGRGMIRYLESKPRCPNCNCDNCKPKEPK